MLQPSPSLGGAPVDAAKHDGREPRVLSGTSIHAATWCKIYVQGVKAYLTVEGHTVAAVVMAVEGLCAQPAASVPDGDCLV